MTIRVSVSGALGNMGLEVVKTVLADNELELAGVCDVKEVGNTLNVATKGLVDSDVVIQDNLSTMLTSSAAQVCVDFTHPDIALPNAMAIIEAGVYPVIGTTGFSPEDIKNVGEAINAKNIGGLIAPNFAIGAILMMKFAREASKYLDHAEIVELHHNQKADAPSGTAIKTAELMAESCSQFGASNAPEKEIYEGARGGEGPAGIRIHSVRLPGYVASQEVMFGGQGQILKIRHDSIDRSSFMPGVALACKKIINTKGFIYGLEHLL